MLQNTTAKAKYMLDRVGDFRIIFRNVFEHGMFLSEIDYYEDFHQRRNDTFAFDHLSTVIKREDIVNILEKDFALLSMMKEIVLSLPPITYFFYSDLEIDNRETLVVSFPANSIWQRISAFATRWTESEGTSSSFMNMS